MCGSTLSLMDAGVPIKAPVAGIAMGLIKEGDDYIILTDIAGVEDHLGDMDFKVAGTEDGITALQMDIKITGVTFEIMRDALAQAKVARKFILGEMAKVIDAPRSELSKYAPGISSIKIDPEKIGLLIGKGGETIRALQEEFESQIDVNDEGMVLVYAADRERGDALVDRIRSMTKEVEVGDEFTGKVVKTTTFGAFVELAKGTDGLLHISNVAPGRRIATVEEVLNKGDEVNVARGRGRPRARPHRPAPRRRPGDPGKTVEELAAVGTGDNGPPRRDRGGRDGRDGRDRDRRGPRDRDRPREGAVTAAGTAIGAGCATATPIVRARRRGTHVLEQHRLTTLESGVRIVTEAMPSVRSVSLGFWIGTGSRDEIRRRGGALAPARAPAVQGLGEVRVARDRPDLRRDGRRAQRRHRQGDDVGLRPGDRRPAVATPST